MESDLLKHLKQSALGLLSRREYSRHELEQRLARAALKWSAAAGESDALEGDFGEVIARVLDRLQQQDYQSDRRFAESLLRSRIGRGQGRVRIAQELRHKGVADLLRESVLEGCQQDWFELARSVHQRRFGGRSLADRREQAKQQRFLLYRGFTHGQCRYALEAAAELDRGV
jgi:regulatory protein